MISFRIDWFDLLAILESLLSSKASILQFLAFFIVQLSHPYMTTGKTIALIGKVFVGQIMSLFLNMLSRLLIVFLSRSKHLLISLQETKCTVILESPAGVQPWWIQGDSKVGTESASLEMTYLITDRKGLED